MTQQQVDVLFVTDMSGSMTHLAQAVRDGFNGYISELRSQPADRKNFSVTLTLFEDEAHRPYVWKSLREVRTMDEEMYMPGGMTALLDAVGGTIEGYKGTADRVMLIIQTDGYENSSRHYTYAQVRDLLDAKEKEGWFIVFLGQGGEDVIRGAEKMGIRRAQTVQVTNSSVGTRSAYGAVGQTTFDWMETPDDKLKDRTVYEAMVTKTQKRVNEESGE